MQLPARAVEIINTLYSLNMALARGDDDQRRLLTRTMAEQLCFELGSQWGTKSAGEGRPQSKDAIACRGISRLFSWDWQNGATREPQVVAGQEAEDITGQVFIPVQPINHLNNPTPIPDPPPPTDIKAIVDQLTSMQVQLDRLAVAIVSLAMKPAPPAPSYEGRLFGIKVVLRPV